jgi:hypothetical protein
MVRPGWPSGRAPAPRRGAGGAARDNRGMSIEPTLADADLAALVPEWLDFETAAALLGVTPAKVRTMIRDHQLAAAVPTPGAPGAGHRVPAELIQDGVPVKGLPGLLTLMHDNGYDDRECIAWIFLDQDFPGRAIDALRENRGTEVKRRAQALGF